MRQTLRFINPVYKTDDTNRIIEVGEVVNFILRDGSPQQEILTVVSGDGKSVSWDHTVNSTRKEDVRAVSALHQFTCTYYGGSVSGHAGGDPASF